MINCFLDLEFNLSDDYVKSNIGMECISMGVVLIDDHFKELETFYSTIKPLKNIKLGRYYAKLTHLKQKDIYKSKNFNEVCKDLEDILSKYDDTYQIFTWGDEDKRMLIHDMKLNNYQGKLKSSFYNIIDLQKLVSSSILYHNKVLKKQWGLKDMQLIYRNKEYDNMHNALVDAIVLKDIFIAYKNGKSLNEDYLKQFKEKKDIEINERKKLFAIAKEDFFEPSRVETYIKLSNWKLINKDFLQKYPKIKSKYYNCNKIVSSINGNKIDFYFIYNNDDIYHLPIILDIYNFNKVKRYINNLNRTQKKDA